MSSPLQRTLLVVAELGSQTTPLGKGGQDKGSAALAAPERKCSCVQVVWEGFLTLGSFSALGPGRLQLSF